MADLCESCSRLVPKKATTLKYLKLVLMFASENGHSSCLEVLTNAGCDVNYIYRRKKTSLIHAACNGQIECLDVLTQAGADVNLTVYNGYTALMKAAEKDQNMCVEKLITEGADVNATAKFDKTGLLITAEKGCLKTMKILLVSGAEVNAKLAFGVNPWQVGAPPSIVALFSNHSDCLEMLMQAGADVNVFRNIGATIRGVPVPTIEHKTMVLIKDLTGKNNTLKRKCRKVIRDLLMNLEPQTNLFHKVLQMQLPYLLASYLLYNANPQKMRNNEYL